MDTELKVRLKEMLMSDVRDIVTGEATGKAAYYVRGRISVFRMLLDGEISNDLEDVIDMIIE